MAMNGHSNDIHNEINGHEEMKKRSRIRLPHVIISDEHKRLSRTYVQPAEKDVYFKHLGLKSIMTSRKLRHRLTYDDTHTLSFRFADVEFCTKLVQQLEKRNLEFVIEPRYYRPLRRVGIEKPKSTILMKLIFKSEMELKKKAIEDFRSYVVVVEDMICNNCKEAFNDQHSCYSMETSSDSGISECGSNTMIINAERTGAPLTINQMSSK